MSTGVKSITGAPSGASAGDSSPTAAPDATKPSVRLPPDARAIGLSATGSATAYGDDDETHAISIEPTRVADEPMDNPPTTPERRLDSIDRLPPLPSSPHDDPYIGTIISERYRVLRKLGEGGMGIVYLAEHIVIEKKVALKILSDDFARKADLVARFMQEAKAASRIGHENIVDITDFGQTAAGSVFFSMEYLEGCDLAAAIRDQGPMPFSRVLPIVSQIARALSAAHSKGIIHRDMKPENVFLVTRDGRPDFVKVLDFGIAKMSTLDEPGERLTRTGMIFGTPEYMSPEQARGERPDHRVDIYALGCIIYEMLTGDVPFHAETFMGVLTKHMFEQPPSVSARVVVSPEVEQVVMRALSKNRDERYQSMKELAQALSACATVEEIGAWGIEATSGAFPSPASYTSQREVSAIHRLGAAAELAKNKKKSSSSAGIIIAVLLVLAVIGVVLAVRPKKAPPVATVETPLPIVAPTPAKAGPAVAPPTPIEHTISVDVTPRGAPASLFNGEELLGPLPGTFKLPHSTTVMTVTAKRPGAKDHTFVITPDRDRNYLATLEPQHKGSPSAKKGSTPTPVKSEFQPVADPPPPKIETPAPKPVAKPEGHRRDGDLMNPF